MLISEVEEIMTNLTEKEFEVLKYLVKGYENREIAKNIFMSTFTVKAHVTSIMRKFGVTNRTEAAYHALKNNIVTFEE